MLIDRRVTPALNSLVIIYTPGWREAVWDVKCLAQEHNTVSPARVRTQAARSGVQRVNKEATAPPRHDRLKYFCVVPVSQTMCFKFNHARSYIPWISVATFFPFLGLGECSPCVLWSSATSRFSYRLRAAIKVTIHIQDIFNNKTKAVFIQNRLIWQHNILHRLKVYHLPSCLRACLLSYIFLLLSIHFKMCFLRYVVDMFEVLTKQTSLSIREWHPVDGVIKRYLPSWFSNIRLLQY